MKKQFFINMNCISNLSQTESFTRAAVSQNKLLNLPEHIRKHWKVEYVCMGIETHQGGSRNISRYEYIRKKL